MATKIEVFIPGVPTDELVDGELPKARQKWHAENNPTYPGYTGPVEKTEGESKAPEKDAPATPASKPVEGAKEK